MFWADRTLMKLGPGLYRHLLTRENFQFARQAGATHLVAPGHTPELTCGAPWHAGMAHALG